MTIGMHSIRARILVASLLLLPMAASLSLGGCSRTCSVADTATVVDSQDHWHLAHRVSGSQDKMQFFELYESRPTFDECGMSPIQPTAKEPVEAGEGWLKAVRRRGTRLEIIYTRNEAEAPEPARARLER